MAELSSVSYFSVLFITAISLTSWRFGRIGFNRQVVVPSILALLAFQILYILQGSIVLPGPSQPISIQVMAIVAVVLAFNSVLQLVKWLVVEFFVTRRKIKLPRFLIDFMGWLAIAMVSLAIVRQVFQVELTGLLVTSTLATAIIGLSLQEILGNLFAGVILQIESPFAADDWVEVAGQEGRVIHQNWRTLSILTRMNHHVIFPNNSIAKQKIVNYSRPTAQQRQEVFIGVGYQHAPGEVKQVLLNALTGLKGVLAEPQPKAYLIEYAESAIQYRVTYWIADYAAKVNIEDAVMSRFWYTLQRAGMGLPRPTSEMNVRMMAQDHAERAAGEVLGVIKGFLRSLPLLEELNNAQIKRLAAGAQLHQYTTDEALVRQGEEGDSLFIIKSGHTGIYIKDQNGGKGQLRVDERTAGEFFGEMSLLTGEPRSASVIAEAETEVITIGKKDFVEILTADPMILELLLNALEKRRQNMQTKQAAADARSRQHTTNERSALLQKIVQFLGISMK
ncbi:MAG: cyclic nucleotide-binding domain-containing protein [Ardenticatenaceae bacterium]